MEGRDRSAAAASPGDAADVGAIVSLLLGRRFRRLAAMPKLQLTDVTLVTYCVLA